MKTLLKKTVLMLSGALVISSFAKATVHTVNVQNFSFIPSSFTAVVGDTVKWIWHAGNHTTTSLTIPNGAAAWNSDMTSSVTTFEYKITTPGTYNYWCAVHTTMMEASFTVTTTTGVSAVSSSPKDFANIYPNPANQVINIHLSVSPFQNELRITDILGKEVLKETLTSVDNAIDISTWKKGVYLYHLKNNDEMMEGKFEVQ